MAFPTNWGRSCKLTIQQDKVPGNLTNFPVLLTEANLPSEMFDTDGLYPALNGGGDIRFSSDAAGITQLACEVVTFTNDSTSESKAEIWVKIPSIDSTADTDFYIWYNKAGETQPVESDTFGKHNVWDSNFKFVQHMNQDPSGSSPQMIDSTINSNDGISDGTMSSEDLVVAKVGNGVQFDGIDDKINCGHDPSIQLELGCTLSAIVKFDMIDVPNAIIDTCNNDSLYQGIDFRMLGVGNLLFISVGDGGGTFSADRRSKTGTTAISQDVYYHVTATITDYTDMEIYIDGTNDGGTYSGTGGPISYDSNDLSLGKTTQFFLSGILDEVQLSNIVRSADWIKTSYNTQIEPTTFIIADTQDEEDEIIINVIFFSMNF